MNRLLILTTLSLSLAGCAAQSAVPSHPAPPSPHVTAEPGDAAPAPAPTGGQVRLQAGGIPGSSPHMWGPRTIDLRKVEGGWEVRLHDAETFQGVGMQPHQIQPPRHTCTQWERLPDDVAARAALGSLSLGAEQPIAAEYAIGVLLPWFDASSGPAPQRDPKRATDLGWYHYFGRMTASC